MGASGSKQQTTSSSPYMQFPSFSEERIQQTSGSGKKRSPKSEQKQGSRGDTNDKDGSLGGTPKAERKQGVNKTGSPSPQLQDGPYVLVDEMLRSGFVLSSTSSGSPKKDFNANKCEMSYTFRLEKEDSARAHPEGTPPTPASTREWKGEGSSDAANATTPPALYPTLPDPAVSPGCALDALPAGWLCLADPTPCRAPDLDGDKRSEFSVQQIKSAITAQKWNVRSVLQELYNEQKWNESILEDNKLQAAKLPVKQRRVKQSASAAHKTGSNKTSVIVPSAPPAEETQMLEADVRKREAAAAAGRPRAGRDRAAIAAGAAEQASSAPSKPELPREARSGAADRKRVLRERVSATTHLSRKTAGSGQDQQPQTSDKRLPPAVDIKCDVRGRAGPAYNNQEQAQPVVEAPRPARQLDTPSQPPPSVKKQQQSPLDVPPSRSVRPFSTHGVPSSNGKEPVQPARPVVKQCDRSSQSQASSKEKAQNLESSRPVKKYHSPIKYPVKQSDSASMSQSFIKSQTFESSRPVKQCDSSSKSQSFFKDKSQALESSRPAKQYDRSSKSQSFLKDDSQALESSRPDKQYDSSSKAQLVNTRSKTSIDFARSVQRDDFSSNSSPSDGKQKNGEFAERARPAKQDSRSNQFQPFNNGNKELAQPAEPPRPLSSHHQSHSADRGNTNPRNQKTPSVVNGGEGPSARNSSQQPGGAGGADRGPLPSLFLLASSHAKQRRDGGDRGTNTKEAAGTPLPSDQADRSRDGQNRGYSRGGFGRGRGQRNPNYNASAADSSRAVGHVAENNFYNPGPVTSDARQPARQEAHRGDGGAGYSGDEVPQFGDRGPAAERAGEGAGRHPAGDRYAAGQAVREDRGRGLLGDSPVGNRFAARNAAEGQGLLGDAPVGDNQHQHRWARHTGEAGASRGDQQASQHQRRASNVGEHGYGGDERQSCDRRSAAADRARQGSGSRRDDRQPFDRRSAPAERAGEGSGSRRDDRQPFDRRPADFAGEGPSSRRDDRQPFDHRSAPADFAGEGPSSRRDDRQPFDRRSAPADRPGEDSSLHDRRSASRPKRSAHGGVSGGRGGHGARGRHDNQRRRGRSQSSQRRNHRGPSASGQRGSATAMPEWWD